MAISHNGGALVSDTEVVVTVTLRVEPDGEAPFEVREKFRFPQLSMPSVGQRLSVVYDPEDRERVMLDEDPAGAVASMLAGSGRPVDQLDLVQQLMASATSGASSADTQAIARDWAEQHGATVIEPSAGLVGPAAPPPAAPDPVELLSRLADLKERGLLTDAEFAAQKARILGG